MPFHGIDWRQEYMIEGGGCSPVLSGEHATWLTRFIKKTLKDMIVIWNHPSGFVWKCWVYSQWNSHLIGIMISKTIGFRGLAYFQTHPSQFQASEIYVFETTLSFQKKSCPVSDHFHWVPHTHHPLSGQSHAGASSIQQYPAVRDQVISIM